MIILEIQKIAKVIVRFTISMGYIAFIFSIWRVYTHICKNKSRKSFTIFIAVAMVKCLQKAFWLLEKANIPFRLVAPIISNNYSLVSNVFSSFKLCYEQLSVSHFCDYYVPRLCHKATWTVLERNDESAIFVKKWIRAGI